MFQCSHCPTCADTCSLLSQCVECVVWGTGDLTWALPPPGPASWPHPALCHQQCPLEFTFHMQERAVNDMSRHFHNTGSFSLLKALLLLQSHFLRIFQGTMLNTH